MEGSNRFKVRLESYSHRQTSVPTSSIIFDVMPGIVESIQVEYQSLDPLHMPGSIYTYKGTRAKTFELSELKFVSRTRAEASQNQAYVNILRGWTRPYFGMGGASGAANNRPSTTTQAIGSIGGRGGNVYKVQDKGSARVDANGLRPLSADEVKGVLNTRELNKKATSTIDGGRVKHYVTGKTDPKEQAYLQSTAVQNEVTRVLDNADADTAKWLKLRNSNDSNIVSHSIIKIPTGAGSNGVAVQTQAQQATGGRQDALKMLGAPPEVLFLTAYSDARDKGGSLDKPVNIFRIPVVITSLSLTFPNDVDYIPTLEDQPFPIIMNIGISLTEAHSPREMEKFDLIQYREGLLPGF